MPFQVISFKKNDNKDPENEFTQVLQQSMLENTEVSDNSDDKSKVSGAERMILAMGWTAEDAKLALADERAEDVCVAVSWRKYFF
jgi:hypothetical protein